MKEERILRRMNDRGSLSFFKSNFIACMEKQQDWFAARRKDFRNAMSFHKSKAIRCMMRAVLGRGEQEKHRIFDGCTEKYQGLFEQEIDGYNSVFAKYYEDLLRGLNEYKDKKQEI